MVRRGPKRSSAKPTGNWASAKAANQLAETAPSCVESSDRSRLRSTATIARNGPEELAQRVGEDEGRQRCASVFRRGGESIQGLSGDGARNHPQARACILREHECTARELPAYRIGPSVSPRKTKEGPRRGATLLETHYGFTPAAVRRGSHPREIFTGFRSRSWRPRGPSDLLRHPCAPAGPRRDRAGWRASAPSGG